MIRYFLLWFPMLVLAVLNGAARDLGYKKLAGELMAHQISTLSLLIVFGFYIWFVVRKYPPVSSEQALAIGLFWLVLTLMFEFGFGLAMGNSISALARDYNIMEGRIWILIPVWLAIAPYVFYRTGR